jgi:hypothetical protein
MEQLLPDAPALPGSQAAPAGHARAAAHLLRQHLPGDAALQDEDDAGQTGAVVHRRPAALAGPGPMAREEWWDDLPELIRHKGAGQEAPPRSNYCEWTAHGAPFLLEFLAHVGNLVEPS